MAHLDKLAVLHEGELAAFGPTAAVLARLQGNSAQPVRHLSSHDATAQEAAA
jgi:ABC-type protease/lipase transport system fused ATPase/permease subunit